MFTHIFILFAGLLMIIVGAEFLVKGASGIARKAGISEFVIGLTIVAIGTSAPEMVVSLVGAFEGNSDVSAGNVLGSNIFNGLLILGITAVLAPIELKKNNRYFDIPLYFIFTLGLMFTAQSFTFFGLGGSDELSRWEGLAIFALFVLYIYLTYKRDSLPDSEKEAGNQEDDTSSWLYAIILTAGLGMLTFGGSLFVDAGVEIAHIAGMSDKFIAVTILAVGTSLPEFATCIVAVMQKKSQLALGNILGSNIFNMLLILGTSAMVHPIDFRNIQVFDFAVLLVGGAILWISALARKKKRITYIEGALLLITYAVFMIKTFNNL